MSRSRSERRHHRKRLIAKRLNEFNHFRVAFPLDDAGSRRHAVVRARTGKLCSCWMCGNPRNYRGNSEGAKTWQELRSDLNFRDDLE